MVGPSNKAATTGSRDQKSTGNDAVAPLAAALYLVSTPIGNVRDLSPRARDVLSRADLVACEDTRVTGPFLKRLGIAAKLIAYHDHNAPRQRPKIMERLKNGDSVALVSDAGTPLVSDPGYKLVTACIEAGIAIIPIPGPSAVLAALAVAGLPTDRFFFEGFLPAKSAARKSRLMELAGIPGTLVFMESAGRLAASLTDMADVLGARQAAIARELTKKFEEVRRGQLETLAEHYQEQGRPKGEIMVVVGPPPMDAAPDEAAIDQLLLDALTHGSVKDAAAEVAAKTGQARRDLYARALALRGP